MREALCADRDVLAVVSALTLLQAASAALLVVVALALKSAGASSLAIGEDGQLELFADTERAAP